MADRRVTGTGKDSDGDITSLCGVWGTAARSTVISDIEGGGHSYFVQDALERRADVHVVDVKGTR